MTSRERVRRAARRQPVDRVPVAPYMGNHGARVAGVPIGAYCRSGRVMAEAQFKAWQFYGQDADDSPITAADERPDGVSITFRYRGEEKTALCHY